MNLLYKLMICLFFFLALFLSLFKGSCELLSKYFRFATTAKLPLLSNGIPDKPWVDSQWKVNINVNYSNHQFGILSLNN